MKTTTTEREQQLANLKQWIPEGSTVYTIVRKVSRSGMQRQISLVVFVDGRPIHPNYAASIVLGERIKRGGMKDALVVNGCGMDMGFHLVNSLEHALGYKFGSLRHEWL